jgi:hypothetical protein
MILAIMRFVRDYRISGPCSSFRILKGRTISEPEDGNESGYLTAVFIRIRNDGQHPKTK